VKKVKRGKVISFYIEGNASVASREVHAYIPYGVRLNGPMRVLYVNDGAEALTIGKFSNVLDNLYHYEPEVEKVVVIFVPPKDRHKEYMMNDSFTSWFANDLTKHAERTLGISSRANLRAVQGASLGGLLAAYIGLNHYNKFRNIIAQSPSFWVDDFQIVKDYAKSKKLPLRFFLHTGTINDGLEGGRKMLPILQDKGYNIEYRETNESHNWANWAGQYAEMIRWFSRDGRS
jgi:enterochelin esterase family protein